jgi:hypothetical protein
MGLILDSSVLITAKRQGRNAPQMLTAIARTAGNIEIALSSITLIGLAHGAARADTASRKATAVHPGTTQGPARRVGTTAHPLSGLRLGSLENLC